MLTGKLVSEVDHHTGYVAGIYKFRDLEQWLGVCKPAIILWEKEESPKHFY